jgi:hypothetical protein
MQVVIIQYRMHGWEFGLMVLNQIMFWLYFFIFKVINIVFLEIPIYIKPPLTGTSI